MSTAAWQDYDFYEKQLQHLFAKEKGWTGYMSADCVCIGGSGSYHCHFFRYFLYGSKICLQGLFLISKMLAEELFIQIEILSVI